MVHNETSAIGTNKNDDASNISMNDDEIKHDNLERVQTPKMNKLQTLNIEGRERNSINNMRQTTKEMNFDVDDGEEITKSQIME